MRQKILGNPIVKHCIQFSLSIIEFAEKLEAERKYGIAKQLLRSGTAIGAIVMEAQSAESKADFIHKFKLAEKESLETWYWLYLCSEATTYPFDGILMDKLEEIMKLLYAIIRTSRNNK